jgi:hypothetical protein
VVVGVVRRGFLDGDGVSPPPAPAAADGEVPADVLVVARDLASLSSVGE